MRPPVTLPESLSWLAKFEPRETVALPDPDPRWYEHPGPCAGGWQKCHHLQGSDLHVYPVGSPGEEVFQVSADGPAQVGYGNKVPVLMRGGLETCRRYVEARR